MRKTTCILTRLFLHDDRVRDDRAAGLEERGIMSLVCILLAFLVCSLCSASAFAGSAGISGTFKFVPYEWDMTLSGDGFTFGSQFAFHSYTPDLASNGYSGTVQLFDYLPGGPSTGLDNADVSSGELDGMSGPVTGQYSYSLNYDPSSPASVTGIPVTFFGELTGSVCEPVVTGCTSGAELWALDLSATGTASIDQGYENNDDLNPIVINEIDVNDIVGTITTADPPSVASEASSALLTFLTLLLLALQGWALKLRARSRQIPMQRTLSDGVNSSPTA